MNSLRRRLPVTSRFSPRRAIGDKLRWIAVSVGFWLACAGAALGQRINLGVIAGTTLTDHFRLAPSSGGALFSEPHPDELSLGPTFEFRLTRELSVEADALHRSIKYRTVINTGNGSELVSLSSTGSEWQLPVVLKYALDSSAAVKPFIEGGPAFMPSQSAQHGAVAGVGAEFRFGMLRLSPRIRYNYWSDNNSRPASQDQLILLVGVGQASNSLTANLLGKRYSLGILVGAGLTPGLRTSTSIVQNMIASVKYRESMNPVAALALEVALTDSFFLEADAMYRPLHVTGKDFLTPNGVVHTSESFSILTWQLPILGKYKWRAGSSKPFTEFGPSFRATGNDNGFDPSLHGITAGTGVEILFRKLTVSPTFRYTHWQADTKQPGLISNQAEFMLGVSF